MRSGPLLCIAIAALTGACGNNDSATPTSLGPVTLTITALLPRDADSWAPGEAGQAGDPEPIVLGCDRRLGIETKVTNFYVRPPDTCSSASQCGLLAIDIDAPDAASPGVISVRSVTSNVAVDLSPLEAAGTLDGPHVIRPSLRLTESTEFKGPFVEPPRSLNVSFVSDACDAAGAGGAGGSDAGGAGAGGANTGGAGGAP